MRIPLYQVDAFTSRLFSGNPAAVCPLPEWLPEPTMQAIAAENNLAETAFFAPQNDGYLLRWFTPTVEVDLCGHATLASAYVVTHILAPERRSVTFDTLKSRAAGGDTRRRPAGDGLSGLAPRARTSRSAHPGRARCCASAELCGTRPHPRRLRPRRGSGRSEARLRRDARRSGSRCDRDCT